MHGSVTSSDNKDESAPLLFCGDTLFVGGCGRFFEGTAAEMLHNVDRFAALPPQTQVFCAHEYTESNVRFLCAVEAGNWGGEIKIHNDGSGQSDSIPTSVIEEVKLRRKLGLPAVPSTIERELQYNLFMKCRESRTQRLVGASTAEEAMAKLRTRKNSF